MNTLFDLVIVEDEDNIRDGLATLMNWESLGFTVAAVFKHGESVLDYLRTHAVDALLTDICLGGISGLDIAKWLSENRPSVRTVILSGYSDFTYAQQAVSYKVAKYLLKPVNIAELENAFLSVREDLQKSSMDQKRYQYANRYCIKSLLSLIVNNGQYQNEYSRLVHMEPDLFSGSRGWILASLHTSSHKAGIDDLFCSLFDNNAAFALSAYYQRKCLYLLAIPRTQQECSLDIFKQMLEQAIDQFVQQHNIIVSPVSLSYFNSFSEMETYLSNHQVHLDNEVQIQQAVGYVNDLDFGTLLSLLPTYDDDVLRMLGVLLLARFSQLDAQLSESSQLVDDAEYRRFSLEAGSELQLHINQIISRFQQYMSQSTNQIVSRACMYIDSCRGRKVSLAEVAEQVFVSPTYLSRLFKAQKNMNFKAYVSALTLETAKRLLVNTDAKICDVSEQLGFKDIRHFYKFFSSGTDMTPTEYRKAHRRNV